MKKLNNILIVRTDRIGDVVLTTPVIKSLRAAYPDARISILVAKQTQELVEGNPYLDEVIVDDRTGKHKGLFGYLKLIKNLKQKHFGIALNFHTKKRTNALLFLAGIPKRVGYKNKKLGFLLTDPLEDERHLGKKHEVEYCMDILRFLDVPIQDAEMMIPVHQDTEQWFEKMCQYHRLDQAKKLIVLHPGASDPSKQWLVKGFIELIERLSENSENQFILIGADNIISEGDKIVEGVKGAVTNLIGKTTVGQMASLLNHADLLISNDSGPVHVAVAVGTPVVSIFTRNQPGINPERWKPLSDNSRVVSVPRNDSVSFKKAGAIDENTTEQITVDSVLKEVRELC